MYGPEKETDRQIQPACRTDEIPSVTVDRPHRRRGCQDRRRSRLMCRDSCMFMFAGQYGRTVDYTSSYFISLSISQRSWMEHLSTLSASIPPPVSPAHHRPITHTHTLHLSLSVSLLLYALWVKHMSTWGRVGKAQQKISVAKVQPGKK